jgi:hypothetical protein
MRRTNRRGSGSVVQKAAAKANSDRAQNTDHREPIPVRSEKDDDDLSL